jgi:hypothetical protein
MLNGGFSYWHRTLVLCISVLLEHYSGVENTHFGLRLTPHNSLFLLEPGLNSRNCSDLKIGR